MDFRWVAAITLWTLLSGPVLSTRSVPASAPRTKPATAAQPVQPRVSPVTPAR
jgi:hypothetical protein